MVAMHLTSDMADTLMDIGMSARKRMTDDLQMVGERYWAKVKPASEPICGMSQPCWKWIGALDEKGRPRFKFQGRSMKANRVRYLLAEQELRPYDCVVTLCHEHDCVNPAHHVIGTSQDVRTVWDDHLRPYWQSVLRDAYKAGEMSIDYLTNGFEISPHVARAILDEEIVASSAFDTTP